MPVSSTAARSYRYVLGDWGTSRLRLFLLENARIVGHREAPGVAALTSDPAQALHEALAPWIDPQQPLDVYLAGMIGSRNGLHEVPYVLLPADCTVWAQAAWSTSLEGLSITIAGGLCAPPSDGAGDVMRGEETQIFGAMRLDDSLGSGPQLFILPGTHSKWVEAESGTVIRFRTAFTGELYGLLCNHSTLLRASKRDAEAADSDAGFASGAARSLQLREGLLAALFETRTEQLLRGHSHAWATGFLSGLLIGYEVDTLSANFHVDHGVTIIADPELAALYRRVLSQRGLTVRVLDGAACVIEGLRHLHACLGART